MIFIRLLTIFNKKFYIFLRSSQAFCTSLFRR